MNDKQEAAKTECCEKCRNTYSEGDDLRCMDRSCECHPQKTEQPISRLVEEFMQKTWRSKLERWTSPAGKGHTLAHIEIAFQESLTSLLDTMIAEIEAIPHDEWWDAMPSYKVQKRSGPFAQAKTEGRDALKKLVITIITKYKK